MERNKYYASDFGIVADGTDQSEKIQKALDELNSKNEDCVLIFDTDGPVTITGNIQGKK
jgi:2-C-methyl-D-erythritol 4-phosphate cytidylyltransferase